MDATTQERRMGGPGTFAITLLLIAPSVLALLASSALAHGVRFSASALWFIYKISLYAGCVGVSAAAVLTVIQGTRRQVSSLFVWLMGFSVAAGILSLWYASHIFRTPWYVKP
jgi:hypothetical protein